MKIKLPKPITPRHLIYAGIGILILYLSIRSMFGKSTNNPRDKMDDAIKSVLKPENLSYTTAQYEIFCQRLSTAFVDGWGTDEDAIYEVFQQMKTNSDVLMLIDVYGVRNYPEATLFWGEDWPLIEIIYNELTNSEIAEINSILKTNGITYTF